MAVLAGAAVPASAYVADPSGDAAASMYSPDTVDVVYLTLPPASIESLDKQFKEEEPEEYVEGTFSLAETDGTPDGIGPATTPITVGIRLKGQLGSKRDLAHKAAFKLKMNFVKGQKFRGLKKMTLNNMVQDHSQLHETLAYKAFRSLGVPASRTGYAYVYVNGEDFGMHLNVETLDEVALEKRYGPFQHLYEGAYGTDVETGPDDSAEEIEAAAKGFEVDEGDEEDIADLEGLVATVNSSVPADFSKRVEPLVDLKEMTRMWAVEKYAGHWDGYAGGEGSFWPNNFYIFDGEPSRFQMLPWGTDQTWVEHRTFTGDAGVLYDDCLADSSCMQMYRRSLGEAQSAIAADDLDQMATTTAALLLPWQELEQGNHSRHERSLGEIAEGVQGVHEFLGSRPAELTAALSSLPAELAATGVALQLQPASLPADGAATTTATATVTDVNGDPVPGDQVAFSSSDPGDGIGAVSDNDDGTYTVQITASATPGDATITATDTTAGISGTATLSQIGPASAAALALTPETIGADGAATSTATATLTDSGGHPIAGDAVAFSSSDPDQGIGAVTDNGDGTYSATITASTTVGSATITATDTSPGATATTTKTLTQTAVPASVAVLQLAPSSIAADGVSVSTATVTLTEAQGNPVAGDAVAFSSTDPGQQIGAVTDHGDGTYSAEIIASTTVGDATITATDTSSGATATDTATLTQTTAPATSLALALAPGSIVADGAATSTATATLTDTGGHPIAGDTLTFTSSDPDQEIGDVTDNGDGTYSAVITASTTPGTATITVTDSSVAPALTATQSLTQSAAPTPQIALALAPKSILANGTATTTATATLFDTLGHTIAGAHVTFTSTDPKQKISAVTDHGNGIYTAVITASTTPGTSTVTATDTDVIPALKATATLTQSSVPAPPKSTTKPPPPVLETLPVPPGLPVTVLTGKPPKRGRDRTPTFSFSSEAPGATFVCSVGARPPRACSSPLTLPRLAFGGHVFAVYANDSAGRVGAAVVYRFTVDRRRRQAAKPRSGARGERSHR